MSTPFAEKGSRSKGEASDGDTTSLTLLARVRQSDQQAWTRLVELYGPLVYEWCMRAALKPGDAADVGQEVFTRVWSAIGGFRRERPGDTFRGWLRVITKRQLLDFWRHRQHQPQTVNTDAGDLATLHVEFPDDDDADQLAEDRQLLYLRAIELLRSDFEPVTVEAFWRVVIDGQPVRDVGQQLGITANSVYIAKSRVLARLRSELADD